MFLPINPSVQTLGRVPSCNGLYVLQWILLDGYLFCLLVFSFTAGYGKLDVFYGQRNKFFSLDIDDTLVFLLSMTIGEIQTDLWISTSWHNRLLRAVLVVIINFVYLDSTSIGSIELDRLVIHFLISHDMEGRGNQEITMLIGIDNGFFAFCPFHHVVLDIRLGSIDDFSTAATIGNVGIDGIDMVAFQLCFVDVTYWYTIEVVCGFANGSFSFSIF